MLLELLKTRCAGADDVEIGLDDEFAACQRDRSAPRKNNRVVGQRVGNRLAQRTGTTVGERGHDIRRRVRGAHDRRQHHALKRKSRSANDVIKLHLLRR